MKQPNERLTVTLTVDQRAAVAFLAYRDGHEMASRVIQDMLTRELERRYGKDWRQVVRAWTERGEVAA